MYSKRSGDEEPAPSTIPKHWDDLYPQISAQNAQAMDGTVVEKVVM